MPKNMSFALTIEQIKNKSKTVTRRFSWLSLPPGTVLNAVDKCMGLNKGQKITRLAKIRILSARMEPLNLVTPEECIKEGFPELSPDEFIDMICKHYGRKVTPKSKINRIEFEYI